ncbi:UPF0158 family protein [Chlorobaculum sp. MV4-Y]|uniref:UPF0158 family protein n=1 Tax=Chlorobaculum sp. MV4-Y TaxID=2976335 RepID=UPI0021AF53A8|nr:UPF0158 family protein [Chlorobaculum sp. MV4-Y]UWX57047.1 UPF0158 family protein [Chlorobaculum sp. MV4-Y]
MSVVIRLKDVVDAIGRTDEERRAFLNIRTGRIVTFSRDALDAVELGSAVRAGEEAMVREAGEALLSGDYRELPDQFDIDDCSILRRFCQTVENDELRRGLLRSLQGRGASMRIRSTVDAFGVVDGWTAFRNEALRAIAIDWLGNLGITYSGE